MDRLERIEKLKKLKKLLEQIDYKKLQKLRKEKYLKAGGYYAARRADDLNYINKEEGKALRRAQYLRTGEYGKEGPLEAKLRARQEREATRQSAKRVGQSSGEKAVAGGAKPTGKTIDYAGIDKRLRARHEYHKKTAGRLQGEINVARAQGNKEKVIALQRELGKVQGQGSKIEKLRKGLSLRGARETARSQAINASQNKNAAKSLGKLGKKGKIAAGVAGAALATAAGLKAFAKMKRKKEIAAKLAAQKANKK